MPPWLSPLCLILGKKYTSWHYGLSRSQEINLRGNMPGSKCDEYRMKIFSFYERVPFPFSPVSFLFEIVLPYIPVLFSTDLN